LNKFINPEILTLNNPIKIDINNDLSCNKSNNYLTYNYRGKDNSIKLDFKEDISININPILKENYPDFIKKKNNNYLLNLEPVLLSNYSRDYYEDSKGNRITMDSNLRFSKFVDSHSFVEEYGWILSAFTIFEIKFNYKNKSKLKKLLRRNPLTQSRCTKYLLGF